MIFCTLCRTKIRHTVMYLRGKNSLFGGNNVHIQDLTIKYYNKRAGKMLTGSFL